MTMHESEDTLLGLALGLLGAESEDRARAHLRSCAECRALFSDVQQTIGLLTAAAPEVTAGIPGIADTGRRRFSWLRVAAMLAVGFGLGVVTSETLRSPSITTVRQQIIPQYPTQRDAGFVVCEDVDLRQSRRSGGQ